MTQSINSAPAQAAPETTAATVALASAAGATHSPGLWALAWKRLRADHVAMAAMAVVGLYLVMLVLSASGLLAKDWSQEIGVNYAPPTFMGAQTDAERGFSDNDAVVEAPPPENPVDPLRDILRDLRKSGTVAVAPPVVANDYGIADPLAAEMTEIRAELAKKGGSVVLARKPTLPFGADKWGHDIIKKTIKGAETSIIVGLVAALLAVALGTLFGAVSGYFGGWIDDAFNWFYSIFTSIPYLLLILAVAAVLQQKGVMAIVLILGLTGWTGTYRLIRAEYMKHKSREYVMAADAIGASHWSKMFGHIFPNVSHVSLVQLSISVVGFIKSEVILSFLGFGVPVGVVSWGSMLNEAQNELILGKWWQLAAASIAMAILVTAFSLFTDALRDALDPKLK
ncbi:binding--dependent transport system inner membrane component family protein [Collimonas fungivorans]|uniref:Binding--dependent transport system inner membrane component family protein n=1 Tax=Collimonas fungivorans TaxID=158899 RepID=A0A127PGM1_9BURK|nr:ABC transporter permease [Collimonas fungivorans]AMO96561.1 binding--dependent transport system inner membrane component family protein [Collimonas fungivorans]